MDEKRKRSLPFDDYEYIHQVVYEFIQFWQIASAFTAFYDKKEEIYQGMSLRQSLFEDCFDGYSPRDMVSYRFPRMIPSRKGWPYKTSRKKFLEFIDKLAKESV